MATTTLPTVVTKQGLQPTDPSTIRANLVNLVAASNPDYTANLPGSLIEDIASTDVAAISLMDQARVDTVNSLTPLGANQYLLNQLGNQLGVQTITSTNGSVDIVVTGTPGWVIGRGFILSDGSRQFVLQTTSSIGSTGTSQPLNFVCQTADTAAIPANTVNQLVTQLPTGITAAFNNPNDGIPGSGAESVSDYRSRVLEATQAVSTGMISTLRTALMQVAGVSSRLITVVPVGAQVTGGYKVIVGGGDQYEVGTAIFTAMFDLLALNGSSDPTRTVNVSIYDAPDTYTFPFVRPLPQTVTLNVTWNTDQTNVVSDDAISQLILPVAFNYVNAVVVGKPINEGDLKDQIRTAVTSVLPSLTRLVFGWTVNGTVVAPPAGYDTISGDPEGYFNLAQTDITIVRG